MNLTTPASLHNGKYVLNAQLGKGVFTLTYRATNTELGQTVVIKTIGETLRQHPDFGQFKQQFLEIGDRLKNCTHPNLVPVIDLFEDAGQPYLVLDYIPGQSLAELIQSDVLPEAKAVDYIRQVGNAISVLHRVGLRHQDIKPENIIRHQEHDSVVLCEFGIACEFTPGVLQTHANLLSAGYAAPELYSFEAQRTPAADIYALSATLYCLLTGNPPLPPPVLEALNPDEAASAEALQEQHLFPPGLQQPQDNLSAAIKQAICCGLQIPAQRRPQTVEAWLSLLPSYEKFHTTQPPLSECLVAQFKAHSVQVKSKRTKTTNKMPQAPITGKKTTPQPHTRTVVSPTKTPKVHQALTKRNKLQLLNGFNRSVESINGQRSAAKVKESEKKLSGWLPLRALLMTGAIAASAGIGFGFALRINGSNLPGSTILHTKQSFPPKPMSEASPEPRL